MTQQPQYGSYGDGEQPVCPRHPDRVSYVRCQRCGRPVCPECQRPSAVGVQCVDCAKANRATRRTRTLTSSTPVVTYTVIAVCIVVYIAPLMFKGFEQRFVFYAPALPQEPWRLITSGFLHDSTGILSVHLVMNMVSIWFIGRVLEPALGRWRYAAVLLIGIVGGNAAMGLIDWTTPALGASGGIFALGGALLVGLRHDRSSLISMAVILGINFVYGFLRAGIAWEAHLGGLVTGVLLGLVYEMGHRKALISAEKARSVATLHVFLTVVLLVIVVALGIYAGNRAWDLYLHSYYSVE